jgi:tetratricopeptide (TPR) repeat protein
MRLLFTIVSCAASLDQPEVVESAIGEVGKLPDADRCRALANLNRAWAETSLGRPANALHILDTVLETGLFEATDMRIHKYRLCLFKGEALVHLSRPTDALVWLDAAHDLFPRIESACNIEEQKIFAWIEPSIQIKRANSLLALDRIEESYRAAERVLDFDHPELAALALQYMAECRLWQSLAAEALKLYIDLKERLPSRLVDESRVEQGIANCMTYLDKRQPASKPS